MDELFFINTYLWVFEPRESVDLPFITWPFQDRVFMHFDSAIEHQDMGVEKSRDMGASWMFLTTFFYRWMFRRNMAFGLVARNEDAVDKTDDPDTLMWKLDYHYDNLPAWMQPERNRIRLSMRNMETRGVITGYSATAEVGRGGRKAAFGFDEAAFWHLDAGYSAWASTQHVTNSRIMVSTPQGMVGIFADQMRNEDADMLKVSIHWSEHPDKQHGLYTSTEDADGNYHLTIIDSDYDFPEDYPFILDGKLRSPWYDRQCRRHPVPALIAQELDIDYGASGFPFFPSRVVEDHSRLYSCQPYERGEVDFSTDDHIPTWRPQPGGILLLWIVLTNDNEPPHNHDYVIGVDVSTGTGGEYTTNSTACVYKEATGEKVAEAACNSMMPDKWADYVCALSKWFYGPSGNAYVIWEANGPGLQFKSRFMQIRPERIYYRENVKVRSGRKTDVPGWYSNKETKRALLGHYSHCMREQLVINRSQPALEEMHHYIHNPDGSIDHDRSKVTLDPTSAGENHGDRVIGDALANWAINKKGARGKDKEKDSLDQNGVPPVGTMAHRFYLHEQQDRKASEESWL